MEKETIFAKYKAIEPVIRWLIIDPLRQFRGDVIKVMTLQALGSIFLIGSFLVVIKFVGVLMDEKPAERPLQLLGLAPGLEALFWAVFATALFFLVAGSGLNYLARKGTARLARITEERMLLLVTGTLVRAFTAAPWQRGEALDLNVLKSFYYRGGRFVGRMVMAITTALVPLVLMLLSLVFLFCLKPFLTLLLLGLLAATVPLFKRVADQGRQASEDLLQHARNSSLDKSRFLDLLRRAMFRPKEFTPEDAFWVNGTPAAVGFMDAYERRLRITALSTFLTQTVIALMVSAILLTIIYPVIRGEEAPIQAVLLYLLGFNFFGSGLVAVINCYVTLNVFYSYCRQLVPFLEEEEQRPGAAGAARGTAAAGAEYRLEAGQPLAINLYAPVDRANIPVIYQHLAASFSNLDPAMIGESCLITLHNPLRGKDLPRMLAVATESEVEGLIDKLQALPVNKHVFKKQLRHLKPENFSSEGWAKLGTTPKMLGKAMLLAELPGPRPVFVDGDGFSAMVPKMQKRFLELLADHQVLVVFPRHIKYKNIPNGFFTTLACISSQGLEWLGHFKVARLHNISLASFAQEEPEEIEQDILEEL